MEQLEIPPLNEVPDENASAPELSEEVAAATEASAATSGESSDDGATEAAENEGMAAGGSDEASGDSEATEPESAAGGESTDDALQAAESEGMVAGTPENHGAAAGGSDEESGDSEATEVADTTEPSEVASTESSDYGATEAAENEGMAASALSSLPLADAGGSETSVQSRDREGAVVSENDGAAADGTNEASGGSEEPQPDSGPSIDDLFAEAQPAAPLVEDAQLRAVLEAIVYVAEEPLTLAQLAAALHEPAGRIREVLDQLAAEYDKPEHGITVRQVAGGYKMGTKPEHHEGVRSFVKSLKPPLKLSLPALETLAVIAYKQPVTGPEIMEIRGVQGSGVLKTLLDRKLIAQAGRKNVIGKPLLYKTTKEFLIQFGLKDMSELPSLKEFEEIRRMALSEPEAPAPVSESVAPAPAVPAAETGGESPEPEPPADEPPTGQES